MVAADTATSPARHRILETAEQIVGNVGAAHLTLESLAQAAGISKSGLLYHFPSKEALFGALAQRYVNGMDQCVEAAKCSAGEVSDSSDLKACIVGILGSDPRSRSIGAALLATAANEPALLNLIRERNAFHTQQLSASSLDFARAAIVTLAIDGLMLRESLRISPFTSTQRKRIVAELLEIADESGR